MKPILVLKFGGKALETVEKINNIKDIILTYLEQDVQLVIVVSAMGSMTDELLNLAKSVAKDPSKRELDMLLTIGERMSMALLTMKLNDSKIKAISYTGSQSGIITDECFNDAKIKKVNPARIIAALQHHQVVVVAGFQGVSESKEITTLGRGGSDTTAVALSFALKARKCVFLKDVAGLYTSNPHFNSKATFVEKIDYDSAYEILKDEKRPLINLRAIRLAKKTGVEIEIVSFIDDLFQKKTGTVIRSENNSNDKLNFCPLSSDLET